jgi:hypothetical protein
VFIDGLGDKAGEIPFLASTFIGEELAQGLVEFSGDDEIPAGGGSGHRTLSKLNIRLNR